MTERTDRPALIEGVDWSDLRQRPASDLQVGDQFVTLSMGTAYRYSADGRVDGVRFGMNQMPVDGYLWTLESIDGGVHVGRNQFGRTSTGTPHPDTQVLRVERAS